MKARVLPIPQYAQYDLSRAPFPLRPREFDAIQTWQELVNHCNSCETMCCWPSSLRPKSSTFYADNSSTFYVGCLRGRALYLAAWRAGRLWDAERRLLAWGAQQQGTQWFHRNVALDAMKSVYQAALAGGVVYVGQKP